VRATHEQIVAAGKTADAMIRRGQDPSKTCPLVKGLPVPIDSTGEILPGVRLDVMLPTAIYHQGAYGIGKTGMLAIIFAGDGTGASDGDWVVTKERRARISARFPTGSLSLLPSCSRPYWDVVEHWNSMIMEELVMFWCTLAPIVLSKAWTDNDSDPYYKMVTLLSKWFRLTFNFDSELSDTRAAAEILAEYAVLAEDLYIAKKLPASGIFTHNLAVLVNELVPAHIATGPPGATNELWIERFIRYIIRRGARAATRPEIFIVNEVCRLMALRCALAVYGMPAVRPKRKSGIRDESPPTPAGSNFSSAGTVIPSVTDDYDAVLSELRDSLGDKADAFLCRLGVPVVLTEFTTAEIKGLDVHSTKYTLTKARSAVHVSVLYNKAEHENDTARRATMRAAMDQLEADFTLAGQVGKRVAFKFVSGVRNEYFPGVVTTCQRHASGQRFKVSFWDNDCSAQAAGKWRTNADITQAALDYVQHVAPLFARQGVHTFPVFEYGRVDRFIHAQAGPEVLRFAFVSLFKTTSSPVSRAYVTLDGNTLLGDNDGLFPADKVHHRVIDIDSIHGNVLLYAVPPPAANGLQRNFLATPFIKN